MRTNADLMWSSETTFISSDLFWAPMWMGFPRSNLRQLPSTHMQLCPCNPTAYLSVSDNNAWCSDIIWAVVKHWIAFIQLSSHFQSDGLPNPPAWIKVAPFALRPPAHTGRSWPWQDPMRDPEWWSQLVSWAEMASFPLPPSISTSSRTLTKTTQLGNKNEEGQKEKEKEVEDGEGGWDKSHLIQR